MPMKKHKPEQIVALPPQIEVELANERLRLRTSRMQSRDRVLQSERARTSLRYRSPRTGSRDHLYPRSRSEVANRCGSRSLRILNS